MTVKGSVNDQQNGGAVLHCITYDGREVQVSVQPNIQKVMPSPDGDHLLIPDTFSWLPLDKAEDTTLVEKPEGFSKEAQARRSLATVTLRGGGGAFSVSGFPVDKLASDERSFMSIDDTLFLLAGLGVDTAYAQKKMGEAEYHNMPVDVRVAHYIQPAELQTKIDAAKLAAEVGPAIEAANRLKCDLVKEAADHPGPHGSRCCSLPRLPQCGEPRRLHLVPPEDRRGAGEDLRAPSGSASRSAEHPCPRTREGHAHGGAGDRRPPAVGLYSRLSELYHWGCGITPPNQPC